MGQDFELVKKEAKKNSIKSTFINPTQAELIRKRLIYIAKD